MPRTHYYQKPRAPTSRKRRVTRRFMSEDEIERSGIDVGGAANQTNGELHGASASRNDLVKQ